jgi:N-methylhydantoinase A
VPKAEFSPKPFTGSDGKRALIDLRNVWLPESDAFLPCPVYDRDRLEAGDRFDGPAIVEQMDATTFVPAGMTAHVDAWLNVIMESS